MKSFSQKTHTIMLHTLAGAILGIVILHPMTKVVYWFEFGDELGIKGDGLWRFLLNRLESAFVLEMIPMSLIFALMGSVIGLAFAFYHLALIKQQQAVYHLEKQLAEDLPALIKSGEGEHLEFKSSIRWDLRQEKVNKSLENIIAKTIVGFMNHQGGSLLIGVDDAGNVVGLAHDYQTLKSKNRDGFELFITDLIINRIGADKRASIHCIFYTIEKHDICRIIIDSVNEPVYLKEGSASKYLLRTGNGTRELDAKEAIAHVARQ